MAIPDDESSSFGNIDLDSVGQTDSEPSFTDSSFGDSSFGEGTVTLSESPLKKDAGITVPPLPRFNIYIGMQLIGLIAICLACYLMYRELGTYQFQQEVPAGAVPPPAEVVPAAATGTKAAGTARSATE